jgi:hypothetical protein
MLHFIFVIAFTVIAVIAFSNLIRSFVLLGGQARLFPNMNPGSTSPRPTPHPEMIDAQGRPINEPLLVVRSVDVEDARQKLDAIYNASPSGENKAEES